MRAAERPDVPPRLAALIQRMMAKAREDRPATGVVLLQELRAIDSGSSPVTIVDMPAPVSPLGNLPADVAQLVQQGDTLFEAGIHGGPGARGKLELAKIYLEKALARAPENALILVKLGDVVHVTGIRGFTDLAVASREAHALRLRALAADDNVGEVHTALGVTFLYWEDEFEVAGVELQRGAELSPQHSAGTPTVWCLAQDCRTPPGGT